MKKILFVLLFFVGAASADVFEYELNDEGGFLNDCGGSQTQVSPQPPCTPDGKWYSVDNANGYMEYNWVPDGEVYVNGRVCSEGNNACKNINERFTVVKSFSDKPSYVINQSGELIEVILTFNVNNGKFIFGGEQAGYLIKGTGGAPDWVYNQ